MAADIDSGRFDLDDGIVHRLDRFVRDCMTEDGLPGVSVAVTDREGLKFARGYGSRDLSSNDAATAETVYGIGSVSKSVAALAVLTLVDEGDLTLDDPVVDHLDVSVPTDVTLHHLLSHTSGFPSLAVSEALLARQMGVGEAGVPLGTAADVRAHLAGASEELADDPGERWMYCNTGYTLVGEVVEAVTGSSYTEFVRRELLDPIGMDRSTFDGDRFESFEDRMTPYFPAQDDSDELEPHPLPIREQSAAAGGLLAPVTDLAAYLRVHLRGGTTDADDRLITAETLSRAYGAYAETPSGLYGYGWRTREVVGQTCIGHGGSIAVASAYAGFSPDNDVGVAVLANTSPPAGLTNLGLGVFAALMGEAPEELPYFARRRRLRELDGEYESYRGIKEATVEVEGGVLRVRIDGPIQEGSWLTLVPEDLDAGRFYTPSVAGEHIPVQFDESGDDRWLYIDRWRLRQR